MVNRRAVHPGFTEELRLPLMKKRRTPTEAAFALCPLEFLELILQFIKCLFCLLIQMAADFQFHFGNLRIGLPLRVPDPIFRVLTSKFPKLGQTSWQKKTVPKRPKVYDALGCRVFS
jgi:hypothetical protein